MALDHEPECALSEECSHLLFQFLLHLVHFPVPVILKERGEDMQANVGAAQSAYYRRASHAVKHDEPRTFDNWRDLLYARG